jgi:hypothetical protein
VDSRKKYTWEDETKKKKGSETERSKEIVVQSEWGP